VTQEAARHIQPGTVFLDLSLASPATKREAATLIDVDGTAGAVTTAATVPSKGGAANRSVAGFCGLVGTIERNGPHDAAIAKTSD
jgi:hypothetical protein